MHLRYIMFKSHSKPKICGYDPDLMLKKLKEFKMHDNPVKYVKPMFNFYTLLLIGMSIGIILYIYNLKYAFHKY